MGTIAKTAIPGLGLPITAIDATYDGKWVLATTDRYLMVVNASFKVRLRLSLGAKRATGCAATHGKATAGLRHLHLGSAADLAPAASACASHLPIKPLAFFPAHLELAC